MSYATMTSALRARSSSSWYRWNSESALPRRLHSMTTILPVGNTPTMSGKPFSPIWIARERPFAERRRITPDWFRQAAQPWARSRPMAARTNSLSGCCGSVFTG